MALFLSPVADWVSFCLISHIETSDLYKAAPNFIGKPSPLPPPSVLFIPADKYGRWRFASLNTEPALKGHPSIFDSTWSEASASWYVFESRSPQVHHKHIAHAHSHSQWQAVSSPISLKCMLSDCGRKPEEQPTPNDGQAIKLMKKHS